MIGSTLCHCLNKILLSEAKFFLAKLDRRRQYQGEDMDVYVKEFHEKAMACCDSVAEGVLVDVCLYGMMEEYRIFLENIFFPSFSRLMEAARCNNDSVRRTSKSSSANHLSQMIRLASRKMTIV